MDRHRQRFDRSAALPGLISHVETFFEEPAPARFREEGPGRFCRVIVMDRRGTRMSGPTQGTLAIEDELADLDAVLDAARNERFAENLRQLGQRVLVPGTVYGTVVGGGFDFTDRGLHELRGVPGPWPL